MRSNGEELCGRQGNHSSLSHYHCITFERSHAFSLYCATSSSPLIDWSHLSEENSSFLNLDPPKHTSFAEKRYLRSNQPFDYLRADQNNRHGGIFWQFQYLFLGGCSSRLCSNWCLLIKWIIHNRLGACQSLILCLSLIWQYSPLPSFET